MDKPINSLHFDQVSAFTASVGIDTMLLVEHFISHAHLFATERRGPNQFDKGRYTIFIQVRNACRELVWMAATLDDQRLIDQPDGVTAADPQPKIVVLAGGEGFIEASDEIEKPSVDNHSGRAHQASFEQQGEAVSARFPVISSGIDAPAAAEPDFSGLAQQRFGVLGEILHLSAEFARAPHIVRVEKCDPFAAGL